MNGAARWFERNTHHWDDWTLDDLVAARRETRVSLVVPARNEATTVGDVVTRVRRRAHSHQNLLDLGAMAVQVLGVVPLAERPPARTVA